MSIATFRITLTLLNVIFPHFALIESALDIFEHIFIAWITIRTEQ